MSNGNARTLVSGIQSCRELLQPPLEVAGKPWVRLKYISNPPGAAWWMRHEPAFLSRLGGSD